MSMHCGNFSNFFDCFQKLLRQTSWMMLKRVWKRCPLRPVVRNLYLTVNNVTICSGQEEVFIETEKEETV